MATGHPTRGTTGTNRLRRVDRWLAEQPVLRGRRSPLVVDLGFGASGATTFELHERLARRIPGVRVHGVEIDPERVATARAQLERLGPRVREAVSFGRGGFETPTPGDEQPLVIRALNVLRQYDEPEVPAAWRLMLDRLAPGGLLVEGTCSEIGRVASWIGLGADGPETFTISLHLGALEAPSIAAERLPKALIHRNVPGERVHELLRALDDAWTREAALAPFGPRQRFEAACRRLRDAGWPLPLEPRRWRLGELTLPWSAVAPR
ncbi:MAG: class I SAM-dependent methyltransferase [Microbacteriaceae bacterium]|nr:class I SAM-dependent methyltransferase [Microbacteriaceae bacterium]